MSIPRLTLGHEDDKRESRLTLGFDDDREERLLTLGFDDEDGRVKPEHDGERTVWIFGSNPKAIKKAG